MPFPEASGHLSEVARLAVETDSVIYLTDRGRRLVAIVPAAAAERLERDDAQRMRFRLADAGLLDPGERLAQEAPAEVDLSVVSWQWRGEAMHFTRITVNPAQMGAVPCVRGLRIPVATVVGMIADGMSVAEIVAELPDLNPDDVRESLQFAAEAVRERQLPLVVPA